MIDEFGESSLVSIGHGMGIEPQAVVRAGVWFAASLRSKKSYCLVGCTVSPGFDYRDCELGRREDLVSIYPRHSSLIERYTK